MSHMFNPPHPGAVLQEYLPEGTGISAEMAVRLSKALGTSADPVSGCRATGDGLES